MDIGREIEVARDVLLDHGIVGFGEKILFRIHSEAAFDFGSKKRLPGLCFSLESKQVSC